MYSSIYRVQSSTRRLPIRALFGFTLKQLSPIPPFPSEPLSVVVCPRFTLGHLTDTGHKSAFLWFILTVPTHAINEDLMLHEAFTGNKPSIVHLRIFGCRAHIHVPDEKCHKLNTQSIKCVFLGFAENHKAYICVHCPSGQIFES